MTGVQTCALPILGTYGSLAAFERGLAKFGPRVAKVVEKTPPEVVFDENTGRLTDEGQEIAARAGVSEDELFEAYRTAENDNLAQPAARAADEPAPVAQTPEQAPAPVSETPAPVQAPETPAGVAPEVQARLAEAQSEQIPLTKGQATQDFAAQDAEQSLMAQPTGEGEKARTFKAKQQEAIQAATDRFKASFGDTSLSPAERGQVVKQALSDLRDEGKQGVSAMYARAREAVESLGPAADNIGALETGTLLQKMRELFVDEAVPDPVRQALRQKAAQYGLIGQNPRTVEGITTVNLLDDAGEAAEKIRFVGPPKRLTIENAEDLRKTINDLYQADTSKRSQALKGIIDDAVEQAVERAASEGVGNVGKLYQEARQGFRKQIGRASCRERV